MEHRRLYLQKQLSYRISYTQGMLLECMGGVGLKFGLDPEIMIYSYLDSGRFRSKNEGAQQRSRKCTEKALEYSRELAAGYGARNHNWQN